MQNGMSWYPGPRSVVGSHNLQIDSTITLHTSIVRKCPKVVSSTRVLQQQQQCCESSLGSDLLPAMYTAYRYLVHIKPSEANTKVAKRVRRRESAGDG